MDRHTFRRSLITCALMSSLSALTSAHAATVTTAPLTVNVTPLNNQYESNPVTWLGNGNFVVYWDRPSLLPYSENDPRYDAAGRIFSAAGAALTDEFTGAYQLTFRGNDIDLTPRAAGGYILGWSDYQGYTYGDNYIRAFDDDAVSTTVQFPVSDVSYNSEAYTRSAALPTGEFLTVSRSAEGEQGENLEIYLRKFKPDGTALKNSMRLTPGDADFDSRPRIACNASSMCVVVWHSAPDGKIFSVKAQGFDAIKYKPVGATFTVSGDGVASDGFPTVGIAPSGEFVIAWGRTANPLNTADGGPYTCYFQRFNCSSACPVRRRAGCPSISRRRSAATARCSCRARRARPRRRSATAGTTRGSSPKARARRRWSRARS
jgi:hypothetical protein